MKKFALLAVLIGLSVHLYSQDLIVTSKGDSINCKISKVKKDNIYFTFKYKDEIRNTLLPLSQVSNYQHSYFTKSEVPKKKMIGFEDFQHLRIAINGGYSYRTGKIAESVPADFKDYQKKLKSGYHFGGDVTYYFSESLGFGLRYSLFKSSNSTNIYVQDSLGNRQYGKMSDNLSINFVGPSFSTRFLNKNKSNAFIMNISIGYMGYQDKTTIIDPYKITGNTVGMVTDLGYDIGLSKNLVLGFKLSLVSGTLTKYEVDDGTTTQTVKLDKEEYENLYRIDLSVGLRFCK